MQRVISLAACLITFAFAGVGVAATVVPTEIQQPGTQPNQVRDLESPDKCGQLPWRLQQGG